MSYLTQAAAEIPAAAALVEVERKTHAGKVLAVAKRGQTLVLAVERERGLFPGGEPTPADADAKRSRDHGTEKYLKPTSALADFAHALECGLL